MGRERIEWWHSVSLSLFIILSFILCFFFYSLFFFFLVWFCSFLFSGICLGGEWIEWR